MLFIKKKSICGDSLLEVLRNAQDGKVNKNFIKYIGENECVDFGKLFKDVDDKFGETLFEIIYQLIRTSEGYKKDDKIAQRKAIKNVLINGQDYEWFRKGLKTFFKEAKDTKMRTASNMDVKDVLEEIGVDINSLLEACNVELKFTFNSEQPENSTLTVVDKVFEKIKNSPSTLEDKSVLMEEFIGYLKSQVGWSISLSELKRIMCRNTCYIEGIGDIDVPFAKEQISEFTNQIVNGKIVISSNLSEVFDFDDNGDNSIKRFVETNAIARKFIYADIYDQLFNSETGLFTKNDVKDSAERTKICNNIIECFKSIEIVLRDNNKITVDFSAYKDEFLNLVGLVDVAALFQNDEQLNLSSWIQTQKFKILDSNFNSFFNLMKSNIEGIKLEDFTYWLEKIEDSSLGYDNVKSIVELLLSRDDFNNFGLIKQLIDEKLKPIKDGDDRFFYNQAAVNIFSKVCERAEKLNNASDIILILDALIRKQDECYQCGKLIDALNTACAKTNFNIDAKTVEKARGLIKNKIFVTDMHINDGCNGYKFVIDFQLTEQGYLTIPINVEYLNKDKNQRVNSVLNNYIGQHVDQLNCKCDISGEKSFDNIISQIKGWFNDKNGYASQEVANINEKDSKIRIDSSNDNFIYVLKSKSKLSANTLKTILSKIFDNKNKIEDEKVFFEQFGPWFCHILSNYLDFSTLDKFGLYGLLKLCIGEELKFKDVNNLIQFLETCIAATKKNNKSCVDLNFVIDIVKHIDSSCDMGSVFDFIHDHIYQINRIEDEDGPESYKNGLNQLVRDMVLKILNRSELHELDAKTNKINGLITKLNEKYLYGLVVKGAPYMSMSISLDVRISEKHMQSMRIVIDENGLIDKIYASSLNTFELGELEANHTNENNPNEITLFGGSEKNLINKPNNQKEKEFEEHYKKQKTEGDEESKKEKEIKQQDEKNTEAAKKVWNASKKAREQDDNENRKYFLLKEVKNEFDNAFTKAFGNLKEKQEITDYSKFEVFLEDVQKIWDLVKICAFTEDLKTCLKDKVKEFESLISKNLLTFKQIKKLVDLICDIKENLINIDDFLDVWCKNYLKENDKLEYALSDKVQIKDSILDTLKVFEFVISRKGIGNYDDAKKEIQTFLDSGLFGKDFKLVRKDEEYLSQVKAQIGDIVEKLINKQIDGNNVPPDNIKEQEKKNMEDIFFGYLNEHIFHEMELHIKTHQEADAELKKPKEEEKKQNEEETKQKQEKLARNKKICEELLQSIRSFLGTVDSEPKIESLQNIFQNVKIGDIKSTVDLKEYAVGESEEISQFIELLSQVNAKVKPANIKVDKNEDNGNDINLINLINLFKIQSLSEEQFKTFTTFIASMQYYLTGNKLSLQDLHKDCGKLLKNQISEISKNTIDYVKNVFEVYENSDYIVFDNTVHLANLLGYINFTGRDKDTKKQIVELINQHDIFYKAICDEIACNMQSDVELSEDDFCERVATAVNSFFDPEYVAGIYTNREKLCYPENEKVDENDKENSIKHITVLVANKLCEDGKINKELKEKIVEKLQNKQEFLNNKIELINDNDINIINNNESKNINSNNFGENQKQNNTQHELGNPYTLSAVLDIFSPCISSIIFVIKINKKQHKLTGGDIVLIIVGLVPVISAIVFGILAYKYNQNNLAPEIPKNLKDTVNMNEKNIIKKNDSVTNKNTEINPLSIVDSKRKPNRGKNQDQNSNGPQSLTQQNFC